MECESSSVTTRWSAGSDVPCAPHGNSTARVQTRHSIGPASLGGRRTGHVSTRGLRNVTLPVHRLTDAVRACLAGLAVGERPHGVLLLIEESVGDAALVGEIVGTEGAAEAPDRAAPAARPAGMPNGTPADA